jgi:hypothetical protein
MKIDRQYQHWLRSLVEQVQGVRSLDLLRIISSYYDKERKKDSEPGILEDNYPGSNKEIIPPGLDEMRDPSEEKYQLISDPSKEKYQLFNNKLTSKLIMMPNPAKENFVDFLEKKRDRFNYKEERSGEFPSQNPSLFSSDSKKYLLLDVVNTARDVFRLPDFRLREAGALLEGGLGNPERPYTKAETRYHGIVVPHLAGPIGEFCDRERVLETLRSQIPTEAYMHGVVPTIKKLSKTRQDESLFFEWGV